MHEMGIALEIIDIVKASMPPELAHARVRKIRLKVGKLSAIVPASLRFCLEIAGRDTVIRDAELEIEETPVVARCRACRHQWTIEGPAFSCETCGAADIALVSGRELDVHSIEIEDEEIEDADP